MADSVLAVQQGFDFQAKYFWYKACKLYVKNSNVVNIGWEISDVPGFDDVALYYQPAKLSTYGYEVIREYYQLKFHVSHNSAFSCEALTQPEFIGATSDSLLKKLYKNFQKSPSEYEKSVYHIVNTWGLDRSDVLTTLIDNAGAIILNRLFDGTTDRSKTGKIRKLWREHLGTNDQVIRSVLRQLRIVHSAKSGEYIDDDVNFALNSVGLQPFGSDKRTNPYGDLIRRLHEEKRNFLNREELREILSTENLWVTTTTSEVRSNYRIGVRTFRKGTDTIEFETDEYLSLLHYFDGRYVLEQSLWATEISPALQGLADRALSKEKWERQGRSIGISLSYVDLDIVITSAPSEIGTRMLKSESVTTSLGLEDLLFRNYDWRLTGSWIEPEKAKGGILSEAVKAEVEWKGEPLWIPDRDAGRWETTHPLEQIRWTREKNKNTNKHYVNVVKALKWWRTGKLTDLKYPKGYPIEHMIGDCCPDGIASVAEGVTKTLEKFVADYRIYKTIGSVPKFPDRGVPEHNVWARITADDFKTFYDHAVNYAAIARDALNENSLRKQTEKWREIFGDKFPLAPEDDGGNGRSSNNNFTPLGGFTSRTNVSEPKPERFA